MKNTIVIFILLVFVNGLLFSQWEPFNEGLYGAEVKFMTNNVDYIFFGNSKKGALYRLKKDEDQWVKINKGIEDKEINCIAVNNYIALIGTNSGELYISKDNGASWEDITPNFPFYSIQSIQIKNEEIFIHCWGKGIFSSTDMGMNWTDRTEKLNILKDKFKITSFEFRHDTIIICSGESSRWNKLLYISLDNGETWEMKPAGLFIGRSYSQILFYKDYMILPAGADGVYFTTDLGDSWSLLGGEIPVEAKSVRNGIIKDDYILVGANGVSAIGLNFVSNNWLDRSKGLNNQTINVFSSDQYYIYAGTQYQGIVRTFDYGRTWKQLPMKGLEDIIVQDLTNCEDELYVSSYSCIAKNPKNSLMWNAINNNSGNYNITQIFKNDSLLFIGTNNGLYRSTNDGELWELCNTNGGTVRCIAEYEGNIFVGFKSRNGILYSSDKGKNWGTYNDSIFGSSSIIAMVFQDKKMIFSTNVPGIIYSTDKGENWVKVSENLTHPMGINAILPKDKKIYLGTYLNKGIFIADENFQTFEQYKTSTELDELNILEYKYQGDNIFAATYKGIYLSQDNGIYWRKVSDSLINMSITSFELFGDYVYYGTYGSGVFRAKISDFPIVSVNENKVNSSFTIFPNPVTENLNIMFELDNDSPVSISIQDILGNEVAKILVNEYFSSGKHSQQFNILGLSSGLYFCTLKAGNRVETRKIVILE